MTEINTEKTKAFLIDTVTPDLNWERYSDEHVWLGNSYVIFLTKSEIDKLKQFNFNPNTTNSRKYNTGFLKAFLGKQIEEKYRK